MNNRRANLALSLTSLAFLLYPVIVYFGLQQLELPALAAILLGMTLLRVCFNRSSLSWGLLSGALAIFAYTWLFQQPIGLKLYPAFVNAIFLAVFLYSLHFPPTVVERMARIAEPDLDAAGVHYTRRVTQIWCVFFAINGLIALATVTMTNEIWLLYNGFIAYLAMGALFAGEFIVRHLRRKHQHGKQAAIHRQ
ncbi:MAG: hypothetical protein ACR2PJ_06195 [Pseudomonadales bacterium]